MINLTVMFGGKSVEHEISIITGLQAIENLDKNKYNIIPIYITKDNKFYTGSVLLDIKNYRNLSSLTEEAQQVILVNDNGVQAIQYPIQKFKKNYKQILDVALLALHGTNAEDGTVQGYLEMLGLPYTGCNVCSSAVGMDKFFSKCILKQNNIPVLDGIVYSLEDYKCLDSLIKSIENTYSYPIIIKPINLGSSIGITIVKEHKELINAIDTGFKYSPYILIEPAITNLREINCSVLGNKFGTELSILEEPLNNSQFLSYEDKYLKDKKSSKSTNNAGMANVTRQINPNLPDDLSQKIKDTAKQVFKILKCSGVIRIDFILDTDTNKFYVNEVNTIPGSLSFYLWEPIHKKYSELLDQLINNALKEYREKHNLTYKFDTNVLQLDKLTGTKK